MPMSARLLRPRAAGGFDPRAISGLQAWYDPSDASTVTLDTGVSVLLDKSGNGRTMTQTIGNAQPATTTLNGRVAMSFDGANDELTSSYNVPVGAKTMIAVSRITTSGLRGVFGSVGTARAFLAYQSTDVVLIGAGDVFLTSVSYQANTTYIHTGLWGASSRGLRVNGTSQLSDTYTGTSGGNALRVGASGGSGSVFMLGVIAETMLYDRTLTADECLSIERYLGAKWGVTI